MDVADGATRPGRRRERQQNDFPSLPFKTQPRTRSPPTSPHLPYTFPSQVGTEHVLLGLIAEEPPSKAGYMGTGITLEAARAGVASLTGRARKTVSGHGCGAGEVSLVCWFRAVAVLFYPRRALLSCPAGGRVGPAHRPLLPQTGP
jgi:hypothetical protein